MLLELHIGIYLRARANDDFNTESSKSLHVECEAAVLNSLEV